MAGDSRTNRVPRPRAPVEPRESNGNKQRSKERVKDDLPFAFVYLGFIAAFVGVFHEPMWAQMPTWEQHRNSLLVPEAKTLRLPLLSLFVVCPALHLWRGFIKSRVITPLALSFAGLHPGMLKFDKFCEQAWLAIHYSFASCLALVALSGKPWWPPVLNANSIPAMFTTMEEREQDQEDVRLGLLYSLQLGFYMLELVTLTLSKNRRSDAVVYFLHHFFTLFLMTFSWMSYNHRIGTVVLFLHDIGDIFLPVGKCYTYAEEHIRTTRSAAEFKMHESIGLGFFVLFVIMFALPRLVVFGNLVFQGMIHYPWYNCCTKEVCVAGMQCGNGAAWTTALLGTLGLLYPMHVYWFYLIVKMAIRLLGAEYDDVRSDKDDD